MTECNTVGTLGFACSRQSDHDGIRINIGEHVARNKDGVVLQIWRDSE